jgi:enoyl-CoA hydratase/carnithine racemase
MTARPVLVDGRDGVATITLNRPQKLNALSADLVAALADALDQIEGDGGYRAIVITGAGRAFSAGGDLAGFDAHLSNGEFDQLVRSVELTSQTLARLECSPLPVVAAVNGHAVAGGLELILCCDLVFASTAAKIGDGHLRYGVLPGGGGAVRLMRKLPQNVAIQLLLSGDMVDATEMERWGLANEVVPADRVLERANELAGRFVDLSPLALSRVKEVAYRSLEGGIADGLRLELEAFESHVTSGDLKEGVDAFVGKRRPSFEGR